VAHALNCQDSLENIETHRHTAVAVVDLSVVFVNWNSEDYLQECIASIYENTRGVSLEIIVVDNASPAGTVDSVKQRFPGILLIKSTQNLGFARANNLGFRHSSGARVLILNPDTKLVGPAITTLLLHSTSLPAAGIVGGRLVDPNLTVQTTSIQRFPTILNQIADIEYLRLRWPHSSLWGLGPLFSNNQGPVRVDVIPGACMLLKREVFEQVGMFTEDYFMYAEDIDLNHKVARAGFVNYYIPDATVIHYGGTSSSRQKANQWATIMKYRAMRQYYARNKSRTYAVLYRAAMGLVAAIRLILIAVLQGTFFGKRDAFKGAKAKWVTVLKWSLGLNSRIFNRTTTADGE
jgi:GT2 family glycosyltransferase